jgi:hypothetical protein
MAGMIVYPLGVLVQFIDVYLFVVALVITKNLVCIIFREQRPNMIAAVHGIVPRSWEILLFSFKYMAVIVVFRGILIALASSPLSSGRFHEVTVSKVFIYMFSLLGEGCLAWLLVPAAIRLLRSSANPITSVQDRKIGTLFAVAASAGSLVLEYLVGKVETTIMLDSYWEGMAIAVVNTVIINAPQVLLFIALALLAIQMMEEETMLTELPQAPCGE